MTMSKVKTWKWKRTQDHEYKNILGFDSYNVFWKIQLHLGKMGKQVYNFCPKTGSNDNVELFQEGDFIYLYSENTGLSYAGITVYHLDGDMIGEVENVFLQSDYDFFGVMNSESYKCIDKFFAYSTRHKIKLLSQYLQFNDHDLQYVNYYKGEAIE